MLSVTSIKVDWIVGKDTPVSAIMGNVSIDVLGESSNVPCRIGCPPWLLVVPVVFAAKAL